MKTGLWSQMRLRLGSFGYWALVSLCHFLLWSILVGLLVLLLTDGEILVWTGLRDRILDFLN